MLHTHEALWNLGTYNGCVRWNFPYLSYKRTNKPIPVLLQNDMFYCHCQWFLYTYIHSYIHSYMSFWSRTGMGLLVLIEKDRYEFRNHAYISKSLWGGNCQNIMVLFFCGGVLNIWVHDWGGGRNYFDDFLVLTSNPPPSLSYLPHEGEQALWKFLVTKCRERSPK